MGSVNSVVVGNFVFVTCFICVLLGVSWDCIWCIVVLDLVWGVAVEYLCCCV